jgi:hypothetical protein
MSYSTEVCVFCPGGFGTLSELFEIITLQQTNKIGRIPLILFGSDFWKPIDSTIKEVLLKKYHTVNEKDVELYIIKDDENEILEIIKNSRIRNGDDSLK